MYPSVGIWAMRYYGHQSDPHHLLIGQWHTAMHKPDLITASPTKDSLAAGSIDGTWIQLRFHNLYSKQHCIYIEY